MGNKRHERRGSRRLAAVAKNRDGGQTISLCMIVKDEEKNLAKCLESVQGLVDEIVVVDTGSTDRTVEIAEAMGARVLYFAWTDNFAAARNFAIQNATGTWALHLDADEALERTSSRSLRSLVAKMGLRLACFRLPVVNLLDGGDRPTRVISYQRRLFRRSPDVIRYVGVIHEQLKCLAGDQRWMEETTEEFRVVHYGYLSEAYQEKGKHTRNFPLLVKALNQDPTNPQHHFNIGIQFMTLGDREKAIYHHREGLRLFVQTAPDDLAITAATQIVDHYYTAEHYDEGLALVRTIVARTANPDLNYLVGKCWLALDDLDAAEEHFRRAAAAHGGHHTQFMEGSDSWLPAIGQMDCALRRGSYAAAKRFGAQALAYRPDSRVLELRAQLLQLRGKLSGTQQSAAALGDALMDADDGEGAVHAYAFALEQRASGEVLRKRGLALLRQRRYALAAADFECALRENPADAAAAFSLGEARVHLDQPDQARDAFRLCLRLEPEHVQCHLALFHLEVGEGNDEAALSHGLSAADAKQTDEELWAAVARCYRRLGRAQDAYDMLSSRVDRSPGNKAFVSPMVDLLREHKENEAALTVLWRAIEANEDEGEFYLLLGEVLGDLGRYEDALNAYDIAAAKDPSLPVLVRAREVILKLPTRPTGDGLGWPGGPTGVSSLSSAYRVSSR